MIGRNGWLLRRPYDERGSLMMSKLWRKMRDRLTRLDAPPAGRQGPARKCFYKPHLERLERRDVPSSPNTVMDGSGVLWSFAAIPGPEPDEIFFKKAGRISFV
jgi:hypothetical protein